MELHGREKEIEQLRWEKVSAHMALYDTSRRVVIPLEADEILIGRHGAADIRFTDMSVSVIMQCFMCLTGCGASWIWIPNPEHLSTAGGFVRRSNSKTWTNSVWNKIGDNPAAKEETECIKTDSLMENAPQLSC